MKKNVLIIGIGLIGGSIALAIKEGQSCHITGYDMNKERASLAESLEVIDSHVLDLAEGAENADFIIIAVPVSETLKIIKQLAQLNLKNGTIITDVGSTKKEIVELAHKVLPNHVQFVGGHPMAGSHKSGVEAANKYLFENAYYIITPVEHTQKNAITCLKDLLKGTKAQFIEMNPDEHDHVAGVISHFPHIIASSLVQLAEHYHHENPIIQVLAAGGFKDITRIASSSPKMWGDILLHNREPILKQFDRWLDQMIKIRDDIKFGAKDNIYHFFEHAKEFRDEFSSRKKGAIPAYYDLFVDIPDNPGVVAEITSILAENNISITNIEIIESREDIYGVLRISFRTDQNRHQAQSLISPFYETIVIR